MSDHQISLLILGLSMVFFLVFFKYIFPCLVYGSLSEPPLHRKSREKGPLQVQVMVTGRTGGVNWGGRILQLRVYSEAIWLKPPWMRPFVIFWDEIDKIWEERGEVSLGPIVAFRCIRIDHRSPEAVSPLRIYPTPQDTKLDEALKKLWERCNEAIPGNGEF